MRQHVVNLMCTLPELFRRQISDAVAHISRHDYPDKWPTLITDLIGKLQTQDFSVINGVLETINACFKRCAGRHARPAAAAAG